MTNKINISYEESTERYRLTKRGEHLKRVGQTALRVVTSKAAKHTAAVTTAVAVAYGGVQLNDRDYEFNGDQSVQIGKVGEKDGTLREAMFNNIEGVNGANIDETTDHVREDPRNEILRDADGLIVDVGATVHMPESVEEK